MLRNVMAKRRHGLKLLWVIGILLAALLISKAEVVTLSDSNFEHLTQASTGGTTGSWLILFKANHCPHCKALQPHFDKLADDEEVSENGIVLALQDVPTSRKTSNRFEVRGFPTLIYLHKGHVYTYKGKREYDSIKAFLMGGFEQNNIDNIYRKRPIPPPPSLLEEAMTVAKAIGHELKDAAMGKSGTAGYAMIALITITLIIMIMFIVFLAMFFIPATSATSTHATKKKRA